MSQIPVEIYIDLLNGVIELLTRMSRGSFLQGSYEATLIEAQGAEWVAGGARDHLTKIIEARNMIVNGETNIKNIVNLIRAQNIAAGDKLKEVLEQNLFRHTRLLKDTITQTEQMANNLRQTDPNRLQGVKFFEGGAGGNVARTVSSLPSEQMKQPFIQSQLRPGVERSIVPQAHPMAQRTISLIRQLPVTFEDIRRNIVQITAGLLAAIRLWVSQFLAQASAVARLAMFTLEQALVRFGSRPTMPILFIGGSWRLPGARLDAA